MSRETDLAWAAGIVDGEGCICLHYATTQSGRCYVLRLTVTNTDLRMLEHLKQIIGLGTIHSQMRRNPKYKPCWNWLVCSKKAEEALKLIQPYLIGKREQAELGLLSRKYMGKHGANKPNPNQSQLADIRVQLKDMH